MNTDTLTDTRLLESLFRDFELPCDYGHGGGFLVGGKPSPECENAADWALINACCGQPALRCDQHLRQSQEHLATIGVHCVRCMHLWKPGALLTDRYSRIERIGR
jgi:hypothetical protein